MYTAEGKSIHKNEQKGIRDRVPQISVLVCPVCPVCPVRPVRPVRPVYYLYLIRPACKNVGNAKALTRFDSARGVKCRITLKCKSRDEK